MTPSTEPLVFLPVHFLVLTEKFFSSNQRMPSSPGCLILFSKYFDHDSDHDSFESCWAYELISHPVGFVVDVLVHNVSHYGLCNLELLGDSIHWITRVLWLVISWTCFICLVILTMFDYLEYDLFLVIFNSLLTLKINMIIND